MAITPINHKEPTEMMEENYQSRGYAEDEV
jgi:hypothetical protein